MTKASEKQIGGCHYKDMPIQPSEYIYRNGLNWLQGNAIKYVSRHASKGGLDDLLKAKHYIDLLIEYEYPEQAERREHLDSQADAMDVDVHTFMRALRLDPDQ